MDFSESPNKKWVSNFTQASFGNVALAHNISETENSTPAVQTFPCAFNSQGNVHIKTIQQLHSESRCATHPIPAWYAIMERWWNKFKPRWMDESDGKK